MTITRETVAPGQRSLLEERYGRRPPSTARRALRLAALAVVATAFVAAVVWAALVNANPAVSSRLLAWRVVDDTVVTVRAEVRVAAGVEATCRLRARAADHVVVGRIEVVVPAGAARTVVLDERIRTERAATNAELVGCTAPGQPRPA